MSSKPKPAKASAAAAGHLVRTGPKEVSIHPSRHGKRQQIEKPTTTRALILRNGKHGAMGSGEIIASNKITGREKLDLLAEELIEKMKTAVMSPFKMDTAQKISESQFGLYRDDIVNLKDPELFRHIVEKDLESRTPPDTEPRRNATNLAKIIGTRIHNSYMLASAWKIVNDTLKFLALEKDVTDRNIKMKLKDNEIRAKYLVLYDMVNHLVDMSHSRLSVLATTAPYYHNFFRAKPAEYSREGETEILFEWNKDQNLRTVTKSFLDSIIIELCFPRAPIPKYVLYMLLKECMDESPGDGKRLSQAMSDAIGDLSDAVELQNLLEAPLLGPEGEEWRKEPRQMPEEFEKWVDAQFFSAQASSEVTNWKDMTYPLATTRKKEQLQNIWKTINFNYIKTAGIDIDRLWQLDGALEIIPQWSSYWLQKIDEDDEEDEDGMPRLGKGRKKKPLAIMGPDDAEDSTGSMPALQSVSNSSEDDDYSNISDDEEEESEYESDSDYDTDEEDEIRELVKEAMEAGHEVDWFDTQTPAPELDPLRSDERKGNPFLKALGSLRGRLFNSNPKIKVTAPRGEPRPNARGAFRATPSGVPKAVPSAAPPKPGSQAAKQPEGPQAHKTTMEEVEDEEAGGVSSAKKKKKKRGGKNKKKTTGAAEEPEPEAAAPASPPASPNAPQPARKGLGQSSFGASASTLNIPIVDPSAAHGQSAHSYLKELEESKQRKEKIKSRSDHASIFSGTTSDTKKGGGFLSKLGLGKAKEDQGNKNPKYTWFSRLSKKATESMHQLLRTSEEAGKAPSPMKWETFLKLMREMGFEYDPSTAGSSVRFDPPNKDDSPITIHKPHPDPTLTPIMLRGIGKRLKAYYGWNEDDFIKQTQERAGK